MKLMKKTVPASVTKKKFALPIKLNLVFGLVELIGALMSNSLALMTDAIHDIGDATSLLLARWMDQDAKKHGANPSFTYGYKRLALFSAFVNSMILLMCAALVTPFIITRLLNPQTVNAWIVVLLALIGSLVHLGFLFSYKIGMTEEKRVTLYQLVEDLLGWLMVLMGGVIMLIFNWSFLDSIMALAMVGYLLAASIRDFYVTLLVFLQGVPAQIDLVELTKRIGKLPYVAGVTDFHVWALNEKESVGTLVVKIEKDMTWRRRNAVKASIREILAKWKIKTVTIELQEVGQA